jgi:hypothetical protein
MTKSILICAAIVFAFSFQTMAGTWTTFDYGGAPTQVSAVDGGNMVGCYLASGKSRGFLYDGTNGTTLDAPSSAQTYAWGISGSRIVGYFQDTPPYYEYYGFLREGTNWTALYAPDSINTYAWGIDGTKIVGSYSGSNNGKSHGFIYDLTTQNWNTIDNPSASQYTTVRDIEGNKMVGYSSGTGSMPYQFSFLYDGTNWTNFYYPGAQSTQAYGISGNFIVGYFRYKADTNFYHGFLYNIKDSSWTVLDYPDSFYTQIYGISGNTIVGQYVDSSYTSHGFVYTIPEPTSFILIGAGLLFARSRGKKN